MLAFTLSSSCSSVSFGLGWRFLCNQNVSQVSMIDSGKAQRVIRREGLDS